MMTTTVVAQVSAADHSGETRDEFGHALGPDAVLLRGIIRRALESFEDLGYLDPAGAFADWVDTNLAAVQKERGDVPWDEKLEE